MFNKVLLTILIIYLERKCSLCAKSKVECGYKQCPQTKDGALNVHLIPHSHMDAGWVKTFDEYYFGTRTTVSTANVQLIYHSVLSELLHDKRRKFTFAETAYFWRWWKEQRPATRATFRSLVLEGRVEFAGGGWVQNDEPTAHYSQIIDQYTWGLRKLNDTLGPCGKPKASWQIDTYGHSREQTSLLAQMGYDGLFIGRVDHKEREAMVEEDRMEFMWRGSDVLGKMSDIMTHTLYNLYNAPEGFCFDFLCNDEPIVDDPDSPVYNAEKRVNDFIAQIERQAKYYDHDNIMVTMGGDFTYQSAANWFMNMDKLINHVNTHPGNISDVNIFYSTPSCYLKAIYLYGRRDKAIFTEKGDHLPYGSDASTYWTGYYTSRPSLKYFIRRTHVFLQVVKQLTVIARMGDSFELHLLRHATNLVLHHDTITGTSQQHVTNDFIRLLSEAVDACTKKVSNLLSYMTPTWGGTRRSKSSQQFVVCHQLNMSQCRFTETQDTILLLVYNPTSMKTYYHVRLPAVALHYSIRDYNDEEVEYQLVPLPASVINLPGRSSTVIQELCFEAENIPPLGYTAYYISPVRDQLEENDFAKKHAQKEKVVETEQHEVMPNIANEYLKVSVNKDTGLLEWVQHVDGIRLEISQNFHFYGQVQQGLQSGAYCFRPEQPRPTVITQKATYNVVRGPLVKEIRQRFSDWVTQIIRLYRGEEFVEFEWIVGPVPIGSDLGKEVVTIFKTNVSSNGQFFTDSNGRQMMRRTCWNESATQQQKKPVSACYYPVTSRMCLQSVNTSTGVCVLTDRPQGGTSYVDGEMELMIHRRLLTDDGFGLEESLNEEAYGVGLVVKGKHRIVFGNHKQDIDDLTFSERMSLAARRWHLEPWFFMTSGEKINRRKWQNVRNKRYSALRVHGLPRHVHVLTLEPWKGGSVLLRLENTLEKPLRGRFKNEKPEGPEDFLNKVSHITVQLRQLFVHLKIKKVRETTLAANQWLDDARQMDWSTRYVYQGADDDILSEDNLDYRDDSKPKDKQDDEREYKDTGNYSEEDQEYRKKVSKKPKSEKRSRVTQQSYFGERYRKKRSVNNTEKVKENTVNETSADNNIVDNLNETNDQADNATELPEMSKLQQTNAEITTTLNVKEGRLKIKKKSRQNLFHKWAKPGRSKLFDDLDKSSQEWASSEEDSYVHMKKRSPKKKAGRKNSKQPKAKDKDTHTDLADDGVTKSMFEMYYKSNVAVKSRHVNAKTYSGEEDGNARKNKGMKRYKVNADYMDQDGSREMKTNLRNNNEQFKEDSGEDKFPSISQRRKALKADVPFFMGQASKVRRKKLDSAEEKRDHGEYVKMKETQPKQDHRPTQADVQPEDEELTYDEDEDGEEEGRGERRKRSPMETTETPTLEQTEPPEDPDYTVTLRPTQIRTFVIHFESIKGPNYAT